MKQVIIDYSNNSITYVNDEIGFSQLGIAKEILNLIESEEKEIERLNNIIKEIRDFTKIGSMTYKHILGDFEVIEVESLLKILDKEK